MHYYAGVYKNGDFNNNEMVSARRADYIWYELSASDRSNAAKLKEIDGRPVSAIMVQDFNLTTPGTEFTLTFNRTANGAVPGIVFNDNTTAFLTHTVIFKPGR